MSDTDYSKMIHVETDHEENPLDIFAEILRDHEDTELSEACQLLVDDEDTGGELHNWAFYRIYFKDKFGYFDNHDVIVYALDNDVTINDWRGQPVPLNRWSGTFVVNVLANERLGRKIDMSKCLNGAKAYDNGYRAIN
ncbi:MAG: hypothetical protein ACPGOV_13455 [Magnetovibrionaceae bacterium]